MKRAEILKEAENNFKTISLLWGAYLRAAHPELMRVADADFITPKDVATMMGLLKIARIATGVNPDSFIDLAGYAACAGEKATRKMPEQQNVETCVTCGDIIPEGRLVCPTCEEKQI